MTPGGIGFLVEKEVDAVENQDSVELEASLEREEDSVVEFCEISLDLSGVDRV